MVRQVFAVPIAVYQRVVFTWGPLLAVIFLVGLGGWFSLTARRRGPGVRSKPVILYTGQFAYRYEDWGRNP